MKAHPVPKENDVSDHSTPLKFAPCLHRHVVLDTTGGRRFSAGEVEDDIQERQLCLDCLEVLTEAEVRAAWGEEVEELLQFLQVGENHEEQ